MFKHYIMQDENGKNVAVLTSPFSLDTVAKAIEEDYASGAQVINVDLSKESEKDFTRTALADLIINGENESETYILTPIEVY